MKNRKNKNATIPNLIESERKGGALSTMILLVINADDHRTVSYTHLTLPTIYSV